MNVFKIIIALSLFISLVACSYKIKEEIDYFEEVAVDAFLYSHFPKKICTKTYGLHSITDEEHNNIVLLLKYTMCTNTIDSLKNYFEKNAIAKYHLKDECLFIINATETSESLVLFDKVQDSLDFSKMPCDYKTKKPIPNFNAYFEEPITDYDVYVIEAKNGLYSKLYNFSYNMLMPSYWNHGYSKGVAFSKTTNDIIYWGCMW